MVDHFVMYRVAQALVEVNDVLDLAVVHLEVVAFVLRRNVDLCIRGMR